MINNQFQELNEQELEQCNGGAIPLIVLYGAAAVGGFGTGVGVTVGTVRLLNWLNA